MVIAHEYTCMKTYKTLSIVLGLLVVGLAFLWLSNIGKPAPAKPVEMWHTNTVELWRTNIIDRWCTNVVQATVTNTVANTVTNEVIREVPARLSEQDKRAMTAGYKYISAPMLGDRVDTLYKASPVSVDVELTQTASGICPEDTAKLKRTMERALRSQDLMVAEKSPYQLSLSIDGVWTTDVPSVAILIYRLELKESIALQRQNDIVRFTGVVWSTTKSKLTQSFNVADQVRTSVQGIVAEFGAEYLKSKSREKEVESKLPNLPRDLLSDAR
jgi:hypothetical protein